jgi:hypothetical protein
MLVLQELLVEGSLAFAKDTVGADAAQLTTMVSHAANLQSLMTCANVMVEGHDVLLTTMVYHATNLHRVLLICVRDMVVADCALLQTTVSHAVKLQ